MAQPHIHETLWSDDSASAYLLQINFSDFLEVFKHNFSTIEWVCALEEQSIFYHYLNNSCDRS